MVTSVGQMPEAEMLLSIEVMAAKLGEGNVCREKIHYSALFTNLVRWPAGAVSFPLSDVYWPN